MMMILFEASKNTYLFCKDHPEKDRFNAAQSAAMSFDLGMELDYLIPGTAY